MLGFSVHHKSFRFRAISRIEIITVSRDLRSSSPNRINSGVVIPEQIVVRTILRQSGGRAFRRDLRVIIVELDTSFVVSSSRFMSDTESLLDRKPYLTLVVPNKI